MSIRTRTRGGFSATSTATESSYHTSCAHTSWTQAASYPILGGVFETMTDTVTKGWKKRRAAGDIIFNGMSYQRLEAGGSGAGYHTTSVANTCASPVWKYEWRGDGNLFYVILPKRTVFNSTTLLPIIQKIVAQSTVRDLESEVSTGMLNQRGRADSNLFETLAELNQTLGMLDEPIERVRLSLKRAAIAKQKGKFTGYTRDGISNLYLAWRYGISPVLNDIKAITEGLQKKTEKRRETTRYKRGFETSKVLNSSIVTSGVGEVFYQNVVTESYTIRAMSLDEVSTSLWENIGFTHKNLITVPWELVNYSFVFDWFVNLGDYLGAMVPVPGWKQLGACMTTIHGLTNRYSTLYTTNPAPGTRTIDVPITGTYDLSLLERTRGPLRFPDIVIKNDFRFDKPTRIADSLALLAQQGRSIFSDVGGRVVRPQKRILSSTIGP